MILVLSNSMGVQLLLQILENLKMNYPRSMRCLILVLRTVLACLQYPYLHNQQIVTAGSKVEYVS